MASFMLDDMSVECSMSDPKYAASVATAIAGVVLVVLGRPIFQLFILWPWQYVIKTK